MKNHNYVSYKTAKNYARSLSLNNIPINSCKTWRLYHNIFKLPRNMPMSPHIIYRDNGWISWDNFFEDSFLSYEEAKAIVSKLKIIKISSFITWLQSIDKPRKMPSNPKEYYAGKGWISWADFLGTNVGAHVFIPFEEARSFARSLNLKSNEDWNAFTYSHKFPINIPKSAPAYYKNKGWKGFADWLGYNKPSCVSELVQEGSSRSP